MWIETALRRLRHDGLLLESDRRLPSVTAIVAGEPIHGSWWGNPAARGTYEVLVALEDHPDALRTKLIDVKVTYVHRADVDGPARHRPGARGLANARASAPGEVVTG